MDKRHRKFFNYAGSELRDRRRDRRRVDAATARRSRTTETAATVSIPVRAPDGTDGIATFLVGPASQIVATDAADGEDELSDPDVVELLESLTQALHPASTSSDGELDRPQNEAWVDEI